MILKYILMWISGFLVGYSIRGIHFNRNKEKIIQGMMVHIRPLFRQIDTERNLSLHDVNDKKQNNVTPFIKKYIKETN